MKPNINKSYLIEYTPDGKDGTELSYSGPGTFRGETIIDSEGATLYLMEDLHLEPGFTSSGWFSDNDIKALLNYEQERQTA